MSIRRAFSTTRLSFASIVLAVVIILGTISPISVNACVDTLQLLYPVGGEEVTGIVDIQFSVTITTPAHSHKILVSYSANSDLGPWVDIDVFNKMTDGKASIEWDTSGLPAGHTYRVRLQAFDSSDKTVYLTSMSKADFTVVPLVAERPPNKPANPSPSDLATNVSRDAQLSWTCTDPDSSDTLTFDVYFGDLSPCLALNKVSSNQSETTYNPTLMSSHQYAWQIVAWDSHKASNSSPVWTFSTAPNQPPYAPHDPVPEDSAVVADLSQVLSWIGGDPEGDAVTYSIYLDTTTPPAFLADRTVTFFDSDLDYETLYYWQIIATDEEGSSTPGPIWTFTTQEEPAYTLTVLTVGNGSFIIDPSQEVYHNGDEVELTATAEPGWTFSHWSNDNTDAAITITITGNTTLTATFTQDHYTLTTTTDGSGIITRDPDQTTYIYGQTVELTAQADLGWSLSHWSNNQTNTTIQTTIYGDTELTAVFTQDHYTLTVNIDGQGTISILPSQETYTYGQLVHLTATADPGWAFDHWNGAVAGVNDTISITILGNTEITACFTAQGSQPSSASIKPTAEANGPYRGFLSGPITFSAVGSHDNDESGSRIVKYEWKFSPEDTWTTLSASPIYTYQQAGNYTVTLRVTDDEGQTATDTTYAIVASANYPPSTPVINGPTQGTLDTGYEFTISSTDPEGMPLTYIIDWGDGTYDVRQDQASGVPFSISHTWTHPRPWAITITVKDDLTQTSATTRMLIDSIAITTLGYLIDMNHDGLYDLFETPSGTQVTVNRYTLMLYLLDVDANWLWDYTYNNENHELTPYQASTGLAPEVILLWGLIAAISIMIVISLLILIARRRKKTARQQ